MKLFFVTLLLLATPARAENFQVEFSTYGTEPVLRRETVYRKGMAGQRQAFQARILTHESNELREASFLQKNGKWAVYPAQALPEELKAQMELVASSSSRLQIYGEHPTITPDRSVKEGEKGNPVLLEKKEKRAQGALRCEATSPGFVTCNGVVYKQVADGQITDTGKAIKAPEATIENSETDLPGPPADNATPAN
jgi:hypothetical protein